MAAWIVSFRQLRTSARWNIASARITLGRSPRCRSSRSTVRSSSTRSAGVATRIASCATARSSTRRARRTSIAASSSSLTAVKIATDGTRSVATKIPPDFPRRTSTRPEARARGAPGGASASRCRAARRGRPRWGAARPCGALRARSPPSGARSRPRTSAPCGRARRRTWREPTCPVESRRIAPTVRRGRAQNGVSTVLRQGVNVPSLCRSLNRHVFAAPSRAAVPRPTQLDMSGGDDLTGIGV